MSALERPSRLLTNFSFIDWDQKDLHPDQIYFFARLSLENALLTFDKITVGKAMSHADLFLKSQVSGESGSDIRVF